MKNRILSFLLVLVLLSALAVNASAAHPVPDLSQNGSLTFPAGCEGNVSVFCMGPDARGVTLRGLYYPLVEGTLTAGFPLGVSNHFTGEPAEISVQDGSLLVIWEGKNGLPLHR